MICSAEIFAAIKDAPIAHQGRERPAKKYSSAVLSFPEDVLETYVAREIIPIQ